MADTFDAARNTMLSQHLRARGIRDEAVLTAMARVPRERFVLPGDASLAYEDRALAIDCGQTISQPYIVALMTQALEVAPGMRVLEIGTGSGYQAAVLATLGAEVYSVERHLHLAESAAVRLNLLALPTVHIRVGDGRFGWPEASPFDRALITAAADVIPPAVWDQLDEGGLLVAPLGSRDEQTLQQIRKIGGRAVRQPLTGCRFVPLLPDVSAES
jgi:protein-L-isoaspartate(D-aspartate) O-methyltransferase